MFDSNICIYMQILMLQDNGIDSIKVVTDNI
jgi:hypothetical protein